MKGSFGITFNEDRNVINIKYECGCCYNHFPEGNLENWSSTWTTLCSKHNEAIKAMINTFSEKGEEK